jgi:Zn-dependent peptidase ImmA (M78 family)
VNAIAEDLLGLAVEWRSSTAAACFCPPSAKWYQRRQSPECESFTVAHDLGPWVCPVMEGTVAPIFCHAQDMTLTPDAKSLVREANLCAAELLMREQAVRGSGGNEFGVLEEAACGRLFNFGLGVRPA